MPRYISVLAAAAVACGLTLAGCGDTGNAQTPGATTADAGSSTNSGSDSSGSGGEKLPGVGDKATDGNLTFTVTGVDTSDTLGKDVMATEAKGKYVIVHLTVKNTGDEAATFNAGPSQTAFDADGKKYETSSDAMMTLDNSFLEQINPGNSVKGRLVYDVPKDTKITVVHLQGGTFTDGVKVSLK